MLKLMTGTLAAFLLGAPAYADDVEGKQKEQQHPTAIHALLSFKALDLNGDGKITREEFMAAFDKLDRNKDGVITPDEMSAHETHGAQDKQNKPHPGKSEKQKR